jgi:hypothetical protein
MMKIFSEDFVFVDGNVEAENSTLSSTKFNGGIGTLLVSLLVVLTGVEVKAEANNSVGRQVMSQVAGRDVRAPIFVVPIRHIGVAIKSPALKEGAALPFSQALRQLAPDGWSAWEGNDFVGSLPATLTYRPGKAWFDALGDALFSEALTADIDWKTKRIIIRSQPNVRADSRQTPSFSAPSPAPSQAADARPDNRVASGGVVASGRAGAIGQAERNVTLALNAGERVVSGQQSSLAPVPAFPVASNRSGSNVPANMTAQAASSTTTTSSQVQNTAQSAMSVESTMDVARWQLLPTDVTVHAAFKRWSDTAQWVFLVKGQNYAFETPLEIEADFKEAVCVVIAGMNNAIKQFSGGAGQKKFIDAAFWPKNKVVQVFDDENDLTASAPNGTCRTPKLPNASAPFATTLPSLPVTNNGAPNGGNRVNTNNVLATLSDGSSPGTVLPSKGSR